MTVNFKNVFWDKQTESGRAIEVKDLD